MANLTIKDTFATLEASVDPLKFNLDDYAGGTYGSKEIFDLDGVMGQIDSGNSQKLNAGTITYTFLREGKDLTGLYNNKNYGFTSALGLAAFTAEQKASARDAIGLWDDLIAPTFVEKTGRGADIQFANSWDPAQAYAYYPEYYPGNKNGFTTAQGYKFFGDVFIADPRSYFDGEGNLMYRGNFTNGDLSIGSYGDTTIIHELGHAIGLSHPGAYNFGPGFSVNYENGAEYAQDSEQFSIMSYWDEYETGARVVNWNTFTYRLSDGATFLAEWANPQTPMLHDILTIQDKYGADPTTRADDTVYGFNSTAGKDVYDFTVNSQPFLSIYDAGGIDTLDFSGFSASVVIDLNDGQFSSAGQGNVTVADVIAGLDPIDQAIATAYPDLPGFDDYTASRNFVPPQFVLDIFTGIYMDANAEDIALDWGHEDVRTMQYLNISIAYGTDIENAIGTDQRDLIITNELDNVLTGNGGADVFIIKDGANSAAGESFVFGGVDTITDFEDGVDLVDLTWLGLSASSDVGIDGNRLDIDVDGNGTIDQSIIFDNLAYVPVGSILG